MLVLQTYPPVLGLRSASPFTVKAEALLAMSGLPHELRRVSDPRRAPRGKLPVLLDGDAVIPDSAHIQTHLERVHGADFDGSLDAARRATATAFRRLVEHHLYFIAGHLRWEMHPEAVRDGYFKDVPGPLRGVVFALANRQARRAMHGQGLGRHTRGELVAFAEQDVEALSTELGDRECFLGDRPTSIDATVYGALHGILDCTLDTPLKAAAEARPNLRAYVDRMTGRLFANAPSATSSSTRS